MAVKILQGSRKPARRYARGLAPRTRIWAYGSALAAIVAGVLCRVLIGGFAADLAALALISIALGAVLLLVFVEVGLSEDHDREREEERIRRLARRLEERPKRRRPRFPRRPT
jgi:membrane protein implicated in regulation of membrane protease activity